MAATLASLESMPKPLRLKPRNIELSASDGVSFEGAWISFEAVPHLFLALKTRSGLDLRDARWQFTVGRRDPSTESGNETAIGTITVDEEGGEDGSIDVYVSVALRQSAFQRLQELIIAGTHLAAVQIDVTGTTYSEAVGLLWDHVESRRLLVAEFRWSTGPRFQREQLSGSFLDAVDTPPTPPAPVEVLGTKEITGLLKESKRAIEFILAALVALVLVVSCA